MTDFKLLGVLNSSRPFLNSETWSIKQVSWYIYIYQVYIVSDLREFMKVLKSYNLLDLK